MATKTRALLVSRTTGALVAKGVDAVMQVEKAAYPLAPPPRKSPGVAFYVRAFSAWRRAPATFRREYQLHVYRERRKGKSAYKTTLDAAVSRRDNRQDWEFIVNAQLDNFNLAIAGGPNPTPER